MRTAVLTPVGPKSGLVPHLVPLVEPLNEEQISFELEEEEDEEEEGRRRRCSDARDVRQTADHTRADPPVSGTEPDRPKQNSARLQSGAAVRTWGAKSAERRCCIKEIRQQRAVFLILSGRFDRNFCFSGFYLGFIIIIIN